MVPPPTDDFETRLARARGKHADDGPKGPAPSSALGLAFRLATEFVAGVVVGSLIGWWLDRWLGTAPWLLILFFTLGAAAGFLNVTRTAREMNARLQASPPPAVPDDDDEDDAPEGGGGSKGDGSRGG